MFQNKLVNVLLFVCGVILESVAHVEDPWVNKWGVMLANVGFALGLLTNIKRTIPGKES